uniref:Uncharacterized protein n=1 Tax=Caenorhabditis tropicalis TaxID=1561998 RepID=A0A1I7U5Z1_9PELO
MKIKYTPNIDYSAHINYRNSRIKIVLWTFTQCQHIRYFTGSTDLTFMNFSFGNRIKLRTYTHHFETFLIEEKWKMKKIK